MNKQQIEDAEKCILLSAQGMDMDCRKCSCHLCLGEHIVVGFNKGIVSERERILRIIEMVKKDTNYDLEQDELYGANRMINDIVSAIKR